jgi:hypothetical protein
MVYRSNHFLSSQFLRQEDNKFKASLGYIARRKRRRKK